MKTKLLLLLTLITAPLGAAIYGPAPDYVAEAWYRLPTEGYTLYVETDPTLNAYAVGPPFILNNEVHITTGMIGAHSPNGVRFVLSHEVSHLQLHHMYRLDSRIKALETNALTQSGTSFLNLGFKFEEDEADKRGQELYKEAGWDMSVFKELNDKEKCGMGACKTRCSSLSPFDSHFSFRDRYELLDRRSHAMAL